MKTPACLSSRQAYACPARKRMPSTVATVHQRLKALRSRFLSARRAKSRTRLEARRITVFAQRIGGLTRLIQSSEMPRRTTKALTNAEKTMVVAASSTNRPVKDARRDAPRPSGPSPPPPQPRSIGGGGGPFRTSCVIEPGIYASLRTSGGSDCMMKSRGAPGTLYSYGPWFTTGCAPPKLSTGGGDGTVHSSVVALQGLALARAPHFRLQRRLARKMSCTAAVKYDAWVMNTWSGIRRPRNSTLVKSA